MARRCPSSGWGIALGALGPSRVRHYFKPHPQQKSAAFAGSLRTLCREWILTLEDIRFERRGRRCRACDRGR